MTIEYLTKNNKSIAYSVKAGGAFTFIFLGGFMSDMMGSKATHLEDWAEKNHHGFLRFDYSGHGQSSGIFEKCNISDWVQDAYEIITEKTKGPIILIGSSMGGWISFLIYQKLKHRVVGIITIAAAPDFTEDFFWFNFSDIQKSELLSSGKILLPSDYDEPYPITLKLIEDGRKNLILRTPLNVLCPLRMLQGKEDKSVEVQTAVKLLKHIDCENMQLKLVANADHSFSSPKCLEILEQTIHEIMLEVETS
jgi:pimeloyl-ACP methyl ester carboxylesterase